MPEKKAMDKKLEEIMLSIPALREWKVPEHGILVELQKYFSENPVFHLYYGTGSGQEETLWEEQDSNPGVYTIAYMLSPTAQRAEYGDGLQKPVARVMWKDSGDKMKVSDFFLDYHPMLCFLEQGFYISQIKGESLQRARYFFAKEKM